MSLAARRPPAIPEPARDRDQRVIVHGVSFDAYNTLRDTLDVPGLRLSYLEGALEIMSPSKLHEALKKRIARIVELAAVELDLPIWGYGNTTFRKRAKERGLEPDECYTVGKGMDDEPEDTPPDVALEVVVTRGGIDKLEIYRGLGVREVWFYEADEDEFSFFELVDEASGYRPIERSHLLPALDFAVLRRFVTRADQPAALRELRDLLRAR